MYQAFYKLTGKPFQLTPDPNFFFASEVHARALAYLRYGLHQAQGFVVVTGDPGTGKSMLAQTVLRDLPKQQVMVGTLTNTFLDPDDILRAVVNAFGLQFSQSSKAELIIRFQTFLTQQSRMGKQVLLMVDEAQNLPRAALEELRMLSNFQDGNKMLLQTFLIGQQQLRHTLADPELAQLSQRIIAGCHLRPLNAEETRKYVECRLKAVAWRGDPSLTGEALALIHQGSKGFPRMTNVLCDRLLLAAFLEEKHEITGDLVRSVLEELGSENSGAWVDASKSIEMVGHGELAALPEFIGPDFIAAGEGEEHLAGLDTLFSRTATTASSTVAVPEEPAPLLSPQRDPVFLTTISPFALQQNGGALSANDAAPPLQLSTATSPPRMKSRFTWFVVVLLLLTGGVGYGYYANWWSFETLDHLTSRAVAPSVSTPPVLNNDLSGVINNSAPETAKVPEGLESQRAA
ncbi:MAG: gspA [Halothiobacillaceae bacterium]|nr:MAG: gspA [Halothiobacillaceae bacterium]